MKLVALFVASVIVAVTADSRDFPDRLDHGLNSPEVHRSTTSQDELYSDQSANQALSHGSVLFTDEPQDFASSKEKDGENRKNIQDMKLSHDDPKQYKFSMSNQRQVYFVGSHEGWYHYVEKELQTIQAIIANNNSNLYSKMEDLQENMYNISSNLSLENHYLQNKVNTTRFDLILKHEQLQQNINNMTIKLLSRHKSLQDTILNVHLNLSAKAHSLTYGINNMNSKLNLKLQVLHDYMNTINLNMSLKLESMERNQGTLEQELKNLEGMMDNGSSALKANQESLKINMNSVNTNINSKHQTLNSNLNSKFQSLTSNTNNLNSNLNSKLHSLNLKVESACKTGELKEVSFRTTRGRARATSYWDSNYSAMRGFSGLGYAWHCVKNGRVPQTIWYEFPTALRVAKFSFQARTDKYHETKSYALEQGVSRYEFWGSNSRDCSSSSGRVVLVVDTSGIAFTHYNSPKIEYVKNPNNYRCYGFTIKSSSGNAYVAMSNIRYWHI